MLRKALIMTIHPHIVVPVKPFVMPIALLEPVSFLVTPFPIFHSHPIASIKSAAYYMKFLQIEAPWPKHPIKNSRHSTYSKIKLSIYLFRLLLPWNSLLIWWSLVGVWCFTANPTLSSFVPLFSTGVALPHELPLG